MSSQHKATPAATVTGMAQAGQLAETISAWESGKKGGFEAAIALYLRLRESGKPIDRGGFLARHSDHAEELTDFINNLDHLDGLFGRQHTTRSASETPRRVGNYEILRRIATGGMGVVYKARQVGLGRTVAIKMIRGGHFASKQDVERFEREARIVATLQHPGIVAIHEIGWHECRPYYSMDFVDGPTLAEYIKDHPFTARRGAKCVRRIAQILHYAHLKGVLHRDLKPQNVLLDRKGRLLVADFGLARFVGGDCGLTASGQLLGTASYMPPEQAVGGKDLTVAADVYSLGAVLYELLTRRPPFVEAMPLDTIRKVIGEEPVPPSHVDRTIPRELEAICLKCLEKEPSKRYSSAEALAQDLRSFLCGDPVRARPLHPLARAVRRYRPGKATGTLLASAVLLPIVLVAATFLKRGEAPGLPGNGPEVFAQTLPSDTQGTPPQNRRRAVSPVVAPVLSPVAQLVSAAAYQGTPFGVGKLEFRIPLGADYNWHDDEPAFVTSPDRKIWYGIVDQVISDDARIVTAYFLFKASDQLTVSAATHDRSLVRGWNLPIQQSDELHAATLDAWWKSYCGKMSVASADTLDLVRQYFLEMLSRRLDLKMPKLERSEPPGKELEQHFERMVSMLLGFEAVRQAMADSSELPATANEQVTEYALPKPIDIPQATGFPVRQAKAIESLAWVVPQECFYLRCGQIRNYLWLRDLMMGWGGSLSEIIATSSLEYDVRRRHEQQLAFFPDEIAGEIDPQIADVALVGTDINFRLGAGIGILLEAKPGARLSEVLFEERQRVAEATSASTQIVEIDGKQVALLSTHDGIVRSFYSTVGNFHFVTNSEYLTRRFLQEASDSGENGRALADLPEYAAAANRFEAISSKPAFLYVSDPFLRNVISPSYRIELARREHSARELVLLALARGTAQAEGHKPTQIASLCDGEFLPPGFGQRPDESTPIERDGKLLDSLRGMQGSFLPICDVDIEKITHAELRAFQRFSNSYQTQWSKVAPVSVAFSCVDEPGSWTVDVLVDVEVQGYPASEYSTLFEHLSMVRGTKSTPVAMPAEDLLGVTIRLEGQEAYVAFRDQTVPYNLRQANVHPRGEFAHTTFAKRNWYAVISNPEQGGFSALGELVQLVQGRSETVLAAPADETELGVTKYFDRLLNMGDVPAAVITRALSGMIALTQHAAVKEFQNEAGNWALVTSNPEIAGGVHQAITRESFDAKDASQITVRMGEIRNTRAADYFRACSYQEVRRASAELASTLDRLACHLNLDPLRIRTEIEAALGARIQCPVGGEFTLERLATGQKRWISTHGGQLVWGAKTLEFENELPRGYRIAFLEWLHGLQLKFRLTPLSLKSQLLLTISRPERDPRVIATP